MNKIFKCIYYSPAQKKNKNFTHIFKLLNWLRFPNYQLFNNKYNIIVQDIYGVMVGGALGHTLCTGLAVLGGRIVAQRISVRTGKFCTN